MKTKECENCGGTGECETELYEGLVTCWYCNKTGKENEKR